MGQHRDTARPADQLQGFQCSQPFHPGKGGFPPGKVVPVKGDHPSFGFLPVDIGTQPGGSMGCGFRQQGLSYGPDPSVSGCRSLQ